MPSEREDQSAPSLGQAIMGGIGQAVEAVRDVSDSPGATPLWAAWRTGLKDLADIAGQTFPSEAGRSREELGSIGNPTSQQVTRELDGPDME